MPGQGCQQRLLEGQPDRGEVARVLGLGIDADRAPQSHSLGPGQIEDLVEGRDLVTAVEDGVLGAYGGKSLCCPQCAQLGQREIFGEPAGDGQAVGLFGGPPGRELGVGGDVGGAGDLVFVPGHEDAVTGADQVGFDVVGAEPDGQPVGLQGVFGPVTRGAAVGDDQRTHESSERGFGDVGAGTTRRSDERHSSGVNVVRPRGRSPRFWSRECRCRGPVPAYALVVLS